MSGLNSGVESYVTPGFGEYARKNMHYVQAVRLGDLIKCSGQGGWDPHVDEIDLKTFIKPTLEAEIDQAFSNVENNLKYAGGKGWSQVYKVVTYSTDISSQTEHIVRNLKKCMPKNAPIWTQLGVKELGAPTMHFEIDVEAFDPQEK